MKSPLFLLLSFTFLYANGGDTIKYTDDVNNLADGDNFYSDIHYHSMKDSVAAIVNGRLGNINITDDAEIDLSKLDTVGVIKADSATIPVFKGNETHRGDSNYFAGIGRFAGTLYAPKVDIDSMIGNVKIGGNIGLNCSINDWHSTYSIMDLRGYGVIYGSPNTTDEGSTYGQIGLSQNSKYDGTNSRAIGNGPASSILFGSGKTVFYTADSVGAGEVQTFVKRAEISKTGITTAALNTGNGDCELYPDSTGKAGTSSVCTGNSATATLADSAGKAGTATNVSGGTMSGISLTLNSGDPLSVYDTGSFTVTLNGVSGTVTGTAKYAVVGTFVSIVLPVISGTSNALTMSISGMPASLRPATNIFVNPVFAVDNGSDVVCVVQVAAVGSINFYRDTGGSVLWTASGVKSVYGGTISYVR